MLSPTKPSIVGRLLKRMPWKRQGRWSHSRRHLCIKRIDIDVLECGLKGCSGVETEFLVDLSAFCSRQFVFGPLVGLSRVRTCQCAGPGKGRQCVNRVLALALKVCPGHHVVIVIFKIIGVPQPAQRDCGLMAIPFRQISIRQAIRNQSRIGT